MGQVFYHCATAALYDCLKDNHSIPLLLFSGRFCSYRKPNFPAVSVVTCRDFLALPFLAPEGRDFPAVSVGRSFSGMGNLKKLYGQQANCSGIYSRIFCS
jgi:hypothetical protein